MIEEVARRVAELDGHGRANEFESWSVDDMLTRAALVMGSYTNTTLEGPPSRLVVPTDAADRITSSSSLLRALEAVNPAITSGPIDLGNQHWISIDRNALSQHGERPTTPSVDMFVEPTCDIPRAQWGPQRFGMYTSTASAPGGRSMWRTYLDPYEGSDLFPLPWTTWELEIERTPVIVEVNSAASWIEFVNAYPLHVDGMIYPDWTRAAQFIDGLHVSLRAIVAAQSFTFAVGDHLIASSYWDVESTFWLHWRITGSRLLETVAQSGSPVI